MDNEKIPAIRPKDPMISTLALSVDNSVYRISDNETGSL